MIERTLTVHGADGPIDLALVEAGAGGRPLLLVHGFTGAKEDFADALDDLAGLGWHAVAPDQRGHGASSKPDDLAAYSFDVYARDLVGLLDALGWARAVVLGHSMGGMVVQVLVAEAPDRVDALVLMDTAHGPLDGVGGASVADAMGALVLDHGMEALRSAQEGGSPLDTPAHQRVLATREGYQAFNDRKLLACSPHMVAAMIRQILATDPDLDRLDDLRSVAVPTLVLVGDQDAPFLEPSARMAEAVPGAELVVIPDAGHSPQFEHPDAWWAALTDWLSRLPAPVG